MPDRAQLARELAAEAGSYLRRALSDERIAEFKSDVDLVTRFDRGAQDIVVSGIRAAFPGDTILAEETAGGHPGDGPCWYVDPLDGTTNFVHGLPHFAVSIAFFDGGRPQAAAVYDPNRDELFHAVRGRGAFLGDRPLATSATSTLDHALVVTGFPYDRREKPDLYLEYFRTLLCRTRDLRRFGSASLDLCYVAAGRFDAFWEWGLQPWDTAAGWLVVEEAGGRLSDFDGGPYDAWSRHLLATNGRLHEAMVEAMAGLPRS